jgi:hypothetical protein
MNIPCAGLVTAFICWVVRRGNTTGFALGPMSSTEELFGFVVPIPTDCEIATLDKNNKGSKLKIFINKFYKLKNKVPANH